MSGVDTSAVDALLDEMDEAALVVDRDGTYVAANDAAVARFGYTRAELCSRGPADLTPPEYTVVDRPTEVDEDGSRTFETVRRTRDGRAVPVEVSARRIAYDGQPALLTVVRDVAGRNEDRRRIEALHEGTRQLLDAETVDEVASIATDVASGRLGFTLPSFWTADGDEPRLSLVAGPPDRDAVLGTEADGESAERFGDWLWTVFEAGETRVCEPVPTDADGDGLPTTSAVLVPLGDHGLLACAKRGDEPFDDGLVTLATSLGQSVTAVLDRLERERTLEAEREKYRTLVQSSNDGIAVLQDGHLAMVNREFASMVGAERPAQVEGDEFDQYVAEEYRERVMRQYQAWLAESDPPQRDELQLAPLSGESRTVEYNVSPITFDGERAHLAVLRDVSERRAREEELRQRKEQFRMMFEHHSAPMLLIDPETGAIRDANEAATSFYGYRAAELTDKRIQEINCLSPEEVARERERARAQNRNHFVFEHELADGEVRAVEVHSSPIHLDDDELLFSVIHDIAERVEYEEELERYKQLIENVPVGICRTTPGEQGTFIEVNPAMVEMFDAESRAELLDHEVSDLYADPADRQTFSETLLEDGLVKEREVRLETLSGTPFWGSVTALATETDVGTYFDNVIQDITTRRESEQRLQEQLDDLEVLNQVVRHDIRNDLQLVLAYLDLLDETVETDGETSEYIDNALESAESAVDLTRTARDMAEVMLQSDADRKPVPLGPSVEAGLDEVRSAHAAARITVDGTLPTVSVMADDLLDSVFRNLLKNAVQHNDEDVPEVVVSATERDDRVVVRIADNGPGVPDDRKDEIFGKGEKGLESQGSGIGLYLVHTLVESYGGAVWVEDNDPRGAVFVVELSTAPPR